MVVLVQMVLVRTGQIPKKRGIKVEHGKLEAGGKGSLHQGNSVFMTVQENLLTKGLPPVLPILSVPLVE